MNEASPKGNSGNGSRRPVEIMREINSTRDEMDQTLSAIENRLTPGQLVDQGIDYLKNSGAREYAANLGASLKNAPLPATLTGIGLAWLMAVGNKQPEPSSSGPEMGERIQSAKDAMQSATGAMNSRMQSAKDSMTSTMESARQRASQITDTAGQQMDRIREQWDTILRDNPLVLGAVGLAIGALAAALAPRTRKEDELMGDARDKLVDQAKEAGSEKLDQAKRAVKETAGSVKDAAADAAQKQTGSKFSPTAGQQELQTQQSYPAPSAEEKTEDATKWPASAR